MEPLAIYILILSLCFVSMFIFYKKSQWEVGVLKRAQKSADPTGKAMRKELFKFLEIASKPMAQAADWWSDVILINEMFNTPGAQRLGWVATSALINHQITSAIWTYFENRKIQDALLQLFNLRTFVEVYRSGKLGRPVYSLREMRIMEAILESYPQFLFQMFYLFTLSDFTSEDPGQNIGTFIVQVISIVFSVYSIASVLTYQDIYGLSTRSFVWKFVLILIRVLEIFSRTLAISLAYLYGPQNFIFWFYVVLHPVCLIATFYAYRDLHYDQLKEALMATVSIALNTSRWMAIYLNVFKLVEIIILLCLIPAWINETDRLWPYFCIFGCILFTIPLMVIIKFDFDQYKAAVNRDAQKLLKSGNIDTVCFLVLRGEVVKLTREEYELSGLRANEILESEELTRKFNMNDLRTNFCIPDEDIHDSYPDFLKLHAVKGELMKGRDTFDDPSQCVTISSDDSFIISGSSDSGCTLRIWNKDGSEIATLHGHMSPVSCVAISSDDSFIVSGSWDKTLRIWNKEGNEIATLNGHMDSVYCVAISSDDSFIVSGSGDGTLRIWSKDGSEMAILNGHTNFVWCVEISSDDSFIVSGSGDNTLRIWSKDGGEVATLNGHLQAVYCVAISSNDSFIVSGSVDNTLRIWDKDGSELATLNGHMGGVSCVEISSDNSFIVSGSGDGTLRIWNKDGREMARLNGHTSVVTCVAISSDDSFIVSGSRDKSLRIWDKDGREVAILNGHTDEVNYVAISSSDDFSVWIASLASTLSDGAIRIWESDFSFRTYL